jgi:hypothetical protein
MKKKLINLTKLKQKKKMEEEGDLPSVEKA